MGDSYQLELVVTSTSTSTWQEFPHSSWLSSWLPSLTYLHQNPDPKVSKFLMERIGCNGAMDQVKNPARNQVKKKHTTSEALNQVKNPARNPAKKKHTTSEALNQVKNPARNQAKKKHTTSEALSQVKNPARNPAKGEHTTSEALDQVKNAAKNMDQVKNAAKNLAKKKHTTKIEEHPDRYRLYFFNHNAHAQFNWQGDIFYNSFKFW